MKRLTDAAVALTVVGLFSLLIPGPAGFAGDTPPAEPLMAEQTAVVTERNFFSNFNVSAYSITVGGMEVRAERRGPPCPGTEAGTTLVARYDNTTMFLGDLKAGCKLRIRRMAFPDPAIPE